MDSPAAVDLPITVCRFDADRVAGTYTPCSDSAMRLSRTHARRGHVYGGVFERSSPESRISNPSIVTTFGAHRDDVRPPVAAQEAGW